MSQLTPAIIGIPAESVKSLIFGGYDSSSSLCLQQGQRYIKHDGNLFVIGWRKYVGMLRSRPAVWKSTDNGLTWAVLDAANAPDPFVPASSGFPDVLLPFEGNLVAVQDGTRFRLVQERGYLELTWSAGPTNDYEIQIYTFDCDTELWSANVISGPATSESTITGGRKLLLNAGMRGNELLVLYKATPDNAEITSLLDIYNFELASWTTTGLHIFDGSTHSATEKLAASFVYDGTYVHFFSRDDESFPSVVYHATMDWSNALSTAVNLLDYIDPSWPDPTVFATGHNMISPPVIWDGKVWKGSLSYFEETGDPLSHRSIICWSALIGEASPTWTAESVVLGDPADAYDIYGPYFFPSNGILRCIYRQTTNNDDLTDVINYTNRINGAWTTPAQFYSYELKPPPNTTYDSGFYDNLIKTCSGVADVQSELGFAVIADLWALEPAPDGETLRSMFLSRSNCAASGYWT